MAVSGAIKGGAKGRGGAQTTEEEKKREIIKFTRQGARGAKFEKKGE